MLGESLYDVQGHSPDRFHEEKGDDQLPNATSSQEQPGG